MPRSEPVAPITRTGLPFICPHCKAPCQTLRDLLTCHPRELRAFTDQLIARTAKPDRDDEADHMPLARALTGRVSNVLQREVTQRLEASHDAA